MTEPREKPQEPQLDLRRPRKRQFGALRGKLVVGPEFLEPLPDEELDAWEGASEHDEDRV